MKQTDPGCSQGGTLTVSEFEPVPQPPSGFGLPAEGTVPIMPPGGFPVGLPVGAGAGPGTTAGWLETYRPGEGTERDLSILDEDTELDTKPTTAGKLLAIGGMGAGILFAALLATGAMGGK